MKYTIPNVKNAPPAPVFPVPTIYTPASHGIDICAASEADATTTSTF
jgi:hypothetical protein